MPYRRLPNTDSARLRAMKKALEIGKDTPPFNLAFSMKTLVRLQGFLPVFENSISHQRQTTNNQLDKSKVNQELTRKVRLYLNHFLKVVNMRYIKSINKTYQKTGKSMCVPSLLNPHSPLRLDMLKDKSLP